jgi:hypothetical protein
MGAGRSGSSRWLSLAWWTSVSGLMTALGTLLAAAALVVAVVAWWMPRQPAADPVGPSPAASSADSRTRLLRSPWLGLEFYRDGQRLPIFATPQKSSYDRSRDVVEVDVGGGPFEIRTPALPRDRGLEVCAWTDDSVFAEVQQDEAVTEQSPFYVYKAMADSAAGSGTLFLDHDAFNAFFSERITHISAQQDAVYVSSFEVPERVTPLNANLGPHSTVYLVVFVDRDKDDVTDLDEYEFVVLRR